ncbi:hypothetical protein CEUSTIGMA_g8877.t1 [Chlamydomonas eustigma]|uniref:SWIM-type domain-containing protein n=1 Tax=Chlamydomonas eustigma TaxID=1157962 RepID=A0A250XED6_9CHLO|nr:hypothetical protein CEUSTIGMA_g8877.t1 [Chlamydomonas eustigma]|eukprot:GAX81448.1 hypothetical protein CEUSTIGMA_g8877.t1 [Chlamydomonas eustigma]
MPINKKLQESPLPVEPRKRRTADVSTRNEDDLDASAPVSHSRKYPKLCSNERRLKQDGSIARYRSHPTQAILDRIQRALSQGAGAAHRLYLIDSEPVAPPGSPSGAKQVFAVMGTTGNVYNVTIGCHPGCTCPDKVQRSSVCKHMLFVMLRVLKCGQNNPIIWQDARLPSEADALLAVFLATRTEFDESVMVSQEARRKYMELTGKHYASQDEEAGPSHANSNLSLSNMTSSAADLDAKTECISGPRPFDGEDCPICYETMSSTSNAEATTFCSSCRNSMHKACFDRWVAQKHAAHCAVVTCVYCRQPWAPGGTHHVLKGTAVASPAGSGRRAVGRQYLNLSFALLPDSVE